MEYKPRLFIGSANESLPFVKALKTLLGNEIIAEPWNESFRLSHYTLDELTRKTSEVDLALFILGNEDKTESRKTITLSPRDNVVYEAGLFAGRLGVPRVYLLIAKGTKIPTDWKGLNCIEYDPGLNDPGQAMMEPSVKIQDAISNWKKGVAGSIERMILGHWWQVVINNEIGSVISFMSIRRSNDHLTLKLSGEAWTSEGSPIAKYWSCATSLDTRDNKLSYYWEGEHPRDKNIIEYIGVGEINFSSMLSNNSDDADGWYSETPRTKLNETVLKSAKYKQANEDDVNIMIGRDQSSKKQLINDRLHEFKETIGQ